MTQLLFSVSLTAYYWELVNSLSSGRNLAVASCGMSLTVENLVLVAPLVVPVGHSKKVAKAFLIIFSSMFLRLTVTKCSFPNDSL